MRCLGIMGRWLLEMGIGKRRIYQEETETQMKNSLTPLCPDEGFPK